MPELMEQLRQIRSSNKGKLKSIIQARIEEGKLESVPAYFHVCAAWALVHGAVALYQSEFFKQVIEDQDGFFEFLMDIGVRMGNTGQYRRANNMTPQNDARVEAAHPVEAQSGRTSIE